MHIIIIIVLNELQKPGKALLTLSAVAALVWFFAAMLSIQMPTQSFQVYER